MTVKHNTLSRDNTEIQAFITRLSEYDLMSQIDQVKEEIADFVKTKDKKSIKAFMNRLSQNNFFLSRNGQEYYFYILACLIKNGVSLLPECLIENASVTPERVQILLEAAIDLKQEKNIYTLLWFCACSKSLDYFDMRKPLQASHLKDCSSFFEIMKNWLLENFFISGSLELISESLPLDKMVNFVLNHLSQGDSQKKLLKVRALIEISIFSMNQRNDAVTRKAFTSAYSIDSEIARDYLLEKSKGTFFRNNREKIAHARGLAKIASFILIQHPSFAAKTFVRAVKLNRKIALSEMYAYFKQEKEPERQVEKLVYASIAFHRINPVFSRKLLLRAAKMNKEYTASVLSAYFSGCNHEESLFMLNPLFWNFMIRYSDKAELVCLFNREKETLLDLTLDKRLYSESAKLLTQSSSLEKVEIPETEWVAEKIIRHSRELKIKVSVLTEARKAQSKQEANFDSIRKTSEKKIAANYLLELFQKRYIDLTVCAYLSEQLQLKKPPIELRVIICLNRLNKIGSSREGINTFFKTRKLRNSASKYLLDLLSQRIISQDQYTKLSPYFHDTKVPRFCSVFGRSAKALAVDASRRVRFSPTR